MRDRVERLFLLNAVVPPSPRRRGAARMPSMGCGRWRTTRGNRANTLPTGLNEV
jgi:hypothetical protein